MAGGVEVIQVEVGELQRWRVGSFPEMTDFHLDKGDCSAPKSFCDPVNLWQKKAPSMSCSKAYH